MTVEALLIITKVIVLIVIGQPTVNPENESGLSLLKIYILYFYDVLMLT